MSVAIDPKHHESSIYREVYEVTQGLIRSCGVAQMDYLVGLIVRQGKISATHGQIQRCCSSIPGFTWLDGDLGWFCFDGGPWRMNPLERCVRKILAVSNNRVHVEDIMLGFIRSRRDRGGGHPHAVALFAPVEVYAAAISRLKWVRATQSNFFDSAIPLAAEEELSHVEYLVYELILAGGGDTLDRQSLFQALVEPKKVTLVALQQALMKSPVFRRQQQGVFGLRGVATTPAKAVPTSVTLE